MNDSTIIDQLGGTSAVAKMFEPHITPASVSEWRKLGIPDSRRQTLKLLRPDIFGLPPGCDCKQTEAAA